MNELPAAIDMEKAVLGSCLLYPQQVDSARSRLRASDFYLDGHRRIYAAMMRLDDASRAIDPLTVSQELTDAKELSAAGGPGYVSDLTTGIPRRVSIDDWVAIVKEKAKLRKLVEMAARISGESYEQSEDALAIVSRAQDSIQAILDDSDTDNPHVSAYTVPELDRFEQERRMTRPAGLNYGLAKLDAMTGGMRPGEVCLVGARSGVGKTSLACQVIAANCTAGVPCHFFSLEMTRAQILRRLWSIVSGVAYKRISDAWLSNVDDAARVRDAASTVAEWPLRIHDQSEMHLSQIVASARVSIRRHGTRLVCVDYAQEVNAEGKDQRMKTMAVAQGLTRMVKHEPATLMLLSQLVKGNRESYNKPPIMSDLIESGKLENVAHIAILLHRGWDEEAGRITEDAEIMVPKQRRGDTGTIRARFNRKTVTFEEVHP
jgi:replicative DNA helicase